MKRKEEIAKALHGLTAETRAIVTPLIDEVVFIEENLEYLKKLPFISVNPKNNVQQKYTPAYKQYKELYQQYTVGIKILLSVIDDKAEAIDSPLQKYFKERLEKFEVR